MQPLSAWKWLPWGLGKVTLSDLGLLGQLSHAHQGLGHGSSLKRMQRTGGSVARGSLREPTPGTASALTILEVGCRAVRKPGEWPLLETVASPTATPYAPRTVVLWDTVDMPGELLLVFTTPLQDRLCCPFHGWEN